MAKKENLREIPKKNYVILGILFIATFALIYYLYSWYDVYSKYQREIPIIRNVLPEINSDEADHYIQENSNTVVYLCTASSNECRTFEKSLKKLVEKESLEEYITYINLSDTDTKEFTDRFNLNYEYKKELKNNYPAFIAFEENKIVDILQGDKENKLSIREVEKFLKENKVGE